MNQSEDQDLRQAFDALRRKQAEGTPPLPTLLDRARRGHQAKRPLPRWIPVTGAAAAGILLAVAILRPGGEPPSLVSLGAARWQGPTDFLLRVPGAEYLESVPSIGGSTFIPDSLR